MKSSLWVVIVVVTGIVGFLVGYSVSAYTGIQSIGQAQASEKAREPAKPAGHAAAPAGSAGGYGEPAQSPKPAAAAGYGGAENPAPKPSPAKPAAAGY